MYEYSILFGNYLYIWHNLLFGRTFDSRLKTILFLPETSVTVKWEDSSKTKNVASEEPPQKKIKKPLSKRDPKVKVITEHSYIYIHIYGN